MLFQNPKSIRQKIMSVITDVIGREILDSRGNPTVECDVILESGIIGRASVPSGASTGLKEAVELRDKDLLRYRGKGVLNAVKKLNTEISSAIIGCDAREQTLIDRSLIELDGTENKKRLGANAILAASIATARAAANESGFPLYRYFGGSTSRNMPVPMMNIINGGVHSNNGLNIQEFMILPIGAKNFCEALRWGVEIFHVLKELIKKDGMPTTVGDEGGFAPNLKNHEAAIRLILKAIDEAGYLPRTQIVLGLDCASSEFYRNGKYILNGKNQSALESKDFADLLQSWCEEYPIFSIEDGMAEEDWDGWAILTEKLGKKIQLVGDDLFVTNVRILREGIQRNIANSIIIKMNQIGTLTETFSTVELARSAGYVPIISHRSGETEDSTISDISVAINARQIKAGSASRSDRIAKYNRLLRIEEELGSSVTYSGENILFNRLT